MRKEGNDIQFISICPMANKIDSAITQLNNHHLQENIGNLDLVSLRPFPYEDVNQYLLNGTCPIVVVHEEPEFQGIGNQVISIFKKENLLRCACSSL